MPEKHLATGDPMPPLSAGKLRLYSMRFCPFAMRTRLVLAAKHIQYETVNINLDKKPEWYLAKHPAGKVPMLEQDGKLINESLITSDYLDEAYPTNPLHPNDPYLKAKQRLLVEDFGEINGLMGKIIFSKDRKEGIDALQLAFGKLEKYENILKESGSQYFRGDTPGMVDYMIFPFFHRLDLGSDFIGPDAGFPRDKLPVLGAWLERMKKDPAVVTCCPDREITVKFYKSYIAGQRVFDLET